MIIKTASGQEFNLDFEPILRLAADPANYTEFIVNQINSGYYCLQECGTVIDAGANVGFFSIYASTVADKVYAIEPTPQHYDNLCAIIKHLGITNIIPVRVALWKEDGSVQFDLFGGGNTTMNTISPYGQITVEACTVETLFNKLQIDRADFFKCDIEGAEHFVDFTPVADKIEHLFIEVHNDYPTPGLSINNVEPRLKKLWKHAVRLTDDSIFCTNYNYFTEP